MFEKHFGLRENPFHSGHQLRFLYPSREHQEARAHLRYGIENREPFVLITGEVGTGKTTALYDALAEWGTKVAVALITNSALTRQELIEEICLRFGINVPPGASKPQALSLLERHLTSVRARAEYAVLLLDEAQNLAPELLEEIRLLSNLEVQGERLLQIFLVGQPELEAQLAAPQLRQLRQRISVHYRLNPLSPEETGAYIHHRVAVAGGNPWSTFPPESCREVYRISHGIPREINTVASAALITAFSEGATTVQPDHVRAITRESDFRSVLAAAEPDAEPTPPFALPQIAPAPLPALAPPASWSEPPVVAAPRTEAAMPVPVPVPEPPSAEDMRSHGPWPAASTHASEPTDEESLDEAEETWSSDTEAAPPAPQAAPVAPPVMARAEVTPAPAPAWTPPELGESPVPSVVPSVVPAAEPATAPVRSAETEAGHETAFREATRVVDAWTAAAQELMEARRRNAPQETAERVEIVAARPTPFAPAAAAPQHEEEPGSQPEPTAHFPTPAELFARAEHAQPHAADLSGLPERLRAKIAADIAADEKRDAGKRRALPAVLVAVVVAALAVGAVMLQKLQVIDVPALRGLAGTHAARSATPVSTAAARTRPAEPTPASPPAPETVVEAMPSAPPAASADSARHRALAALPDVPGAAAASKPTPAPPPEMTRSTPAPQGNAPPVTQPPAHPTAAAPKVVTAKSAPVTHVPTATASRTATPPPAAARPATPKPVAARTDSTVYGLGVASYLDRDRAEQEQARLASASGLPATVIPFNDEGTTKFRVVLGHFPSNAAAEDAAVAIMDKYKVSEARPLVLSRHKSR